MNTLSLKQLETFSKNLFSDDKDIRKNARASIIKHKGFFIKKFTEKMLIACPNYYLVSHAIHAFVKENEFVFKIHEEKSGTIQETGKKHKEGKHSFLNTDSEKRTYFAAMPHLVGSQHSLKEQIDLLFNEGFGENTKESNQEAKRRLHLFVGMNYCHSIDKKINREKKDKLEELWTNAELIHSNVSYTAFRWEPVWTPSDSNDKVPQSKVKRLFRLLQEMDETKASKVYRDVMKIKKVVPYQYIREEIKDSTPFNSVFKAFRQNNANRPFDFVTLDDDAVRIRTGLVGLFSQYDILHKKFPDLQVATTGYYMTDPNNFSVEFMSKTNLSARWGLGTVRTNGAYLPEPNIAVTGPSGHEFSPNISYLRKGDDKGKGMESIGLLENLNLMKGDVQGKVIFGTEGAIQTAVSPNVKIPKHLKENVTPQSFLLPENLASLRSFSQSAISPIGFAANILRTFPKGTNTSSYKPSVMEIFKAFDPVEYAKFLPNYWLKTYLQVALKVNKYSGIIKDLKKLSEKGALEVVKTCKVDLTYQKPIGSLIRLKVESLTQAKKTLTDSNKFTKNDVDLLVNTSIAVNGYVFGYFLTAIGAV